MSTSPLPGFGREENGTISVRNVSGSMSPCGRELRTIRLKWVGRDIWYGDFNLPRLRWVVAVERTKGRMDYLYIYLPVDAFVISVCLSSMLSREPVIELPVL